MEILIVEDQFTIANSFRKKCEEFGAKVKIAATVDDACDKFIKYNPTAVFLDIFLKQYGDGFQIAQFIREHSGDTLIYFLTGFDDNKTQEQAHAFENSKLLVKPISKEEFERILITALLKIAGRDEEVNANLSKTTQVDGSKITETTIPSPTSQPQILRPGAISKRLIIAFLMLLAINLFSSFYLANIFSDHYRQEFMQKMNATGDLVGRSARAAIVMDGVMGDDIAAQRHLKLLSQVEAIDGAAFYRTDGKLFAHYSKKSESDFPESQKMESSFVFRDDKLEITRSIELDNQIIGAAFLKVDLSQYNSKIRNYFYQAIIQQLVVFAIIFFIFFRIYKNVVTPIVRLSEHSQKVRDSGVASEIEHHKSDDEIEGLYLNYNHMMRSLGDYQNDLKTLVDERTTELEATIEKMEVHLREVHHRVRNHFEIVIARLEAFGGLKEIVETIYSMAELHKTVYTYNDVAHIDMKDYLPRIWGILEKIYNPKNIKFKLNCDPIIVDAQKAMSIGSMLVEMFSNSLKHAWPDEKPGIISTQLIQTDENILELLVEDDGIGLPEDAEIEPRSFGMDYIMACHDLDPVGEIAIDRKNGTSYRIRFKNK